MGYRQDADNRELGALSQDDLLTWVHRREMTGNLVAEGTSRWHPVDEVRQRFEELRTGGIYCRNGALVIPRGRIRYHFPCGTSLRRPIVTDRLY